MPLHVERGQSSDRTVGLHDLGEVAPEIVFDTVIPRDVAVCEAPSHGQAVLDYMPRCRGTRAYIELCMEVLERV